MSAGFVSTFFATLRIPILGDGPLDILYPWSTVQIDVVYDYRG